MTDFENQVIERLTQIETTLLALVHAISREFSDVDEETFLARGTKGNSGSEVMVTLDGEVFDGMQREQGQSLG